MHSADFLAQKVHRYWTMAEQSVKTSSKICQTKQTVAINAEKKQKNVKIQEKEKKNPKTNKPKTNGPKKKKTYIYIYMNEILINNLWPYSYTAKTLLKNFSS